MSRRQSIGEANRAVEAAKDNNAVDNSKESSDAQETGNTQETKNVHGTENVQESESVQGAENKQNAHDIYGSGSSADKEAAMAANAAKPANPTPKMYMSDGKPVEEECEPVVSARI